MRSVTWTVAFLLAITPAVAGCARTTPPAPAPATVTVQEEAGPEAFAPVSEATGALVAATVVRVVDGDTLHVRTAAGTAEKVRLIGVDAPEYTEEREPYGRESTAYLKDKLPAGRGVWLETDVERRDRYGRLLAYVWVKAPGSKGAAEVSARMVNAMSLKDGYAQLMTVPPNVKYVEVFKTLQTDARQSESGLWGGR